MSAGFSADLSSMKSPKLVSSLSPTGDCSEIGLLRHLQHGANALDRHLHFVGDFLRRRLAAEILDQLLLHPHQLVDRFDHVHRDADGARLIGDGAGDGLANPPGGVGGKLVAAAVFEFLDRLHQAHVAFLDEVEEGEAAVGVFLGDGNDEAQVGFDHFGLWPGAPFCGEIFNWS